MLTQTVPKRFIGLDIHKKYFVAVGVDSKLNQVLGPYEAPMRHLGKWAKKNLNPEDAVVVEVDQTPEQIVTEVLLRLG